MSAITPALALGLTYPESPRWHRGHLYFSDVHAFRLCRCPWDGPVETVSEVPGRPAGIGVLRDGRLLVATALDRLLLRVDVSETPASTTQYADLADLATGLLNDMIVDTSDRAWVGDTGHVLGAPYRPGRLLRCGPDRVAVVAADDLNFPNGLAMAPDGSVLYVAETFARRITAFDVHSDGTLTGRRVYVDLPGIPDGICLDMESHLWIALPDDERFIRVNPVGRVVDTVPTSPWRAIACLLAGAGRRYLVQCLAQTTDGSGGALRYGEIRSQLRSVAGAGVP